MPGPILKLRAHRVEASEKASASVRFEVIDPETGRALPEGQAGELVITTLTKQALPMLRYRTRDITRVTTAPCDCGRKARRTRCSDAMSREARWRRRRRPG